MDIALCCFDFEARRLNYAGANNPLILVRNGEAIKYDASKAPIGAYIGDKLTNFANNEIELASGDMCYIFSDGYADQFGGPENKKFLKRKLIELLAEISTEPINKQKEMLEQAHELWKGDHEQVDDILIIGIRCK
jgi:serine phosphatase RsbU (regulator of sigma subunit)